MSESKYARCYYRVENHKGVVFISPGGYNGITHQAHGWRKFLNDNGYSVFLIHNVMSLLQMKDETELSVDGKPRLKPSVIKRIKMDDLHEAIEALWEVEPTANLRTRIFHLGFSNGCSASQPLSSTMVSPYSNQTFDFRGDIMVYPWLTMLDPAKENKPTKQIKPTLMIMPNDDDYKEQFQANKWFSVQDPNLFEYFEVPGSHAFDNPGSHDRTKVRLKSWDANDGQQMVYDPISTELAHDRVLTFLDKLATAEASKRQYKYLDDIFTY